MYTKMASEREHVVQRSDKGTVLSWVRGASSGSIGVAARTNHGEGHTEGTLSPGGPALQSHPGFLGVHFIPYTGLMEVSLPRSRLVEVICGLRRRKGNGRTRKPETNKKKTGLSEEPLRNKKNDLPSVLLA